MNGVSAMFWIIWRTLWRIFEQKKRRKGDGRGEIGVVGWGAFLGMEDGGDEGSFVVHNHRTCTREYMYKKLQYAWRS